MDYRSQLSDGSKRWMTLSLSLLSAKDATRFSQKLVASPYGRGSVRPMVLGRNPSVVVQMPPSLFGYGGAAQEQARPSEATGGTKRRAWDDSLALAYFFVHIRRGSMRIGLVPERNAMKVSRVTKPPPLVFVAYNYETAP